MLDIRNMYSIDLYAKWSFESLPDHKIEAHLFCFSGMSITSMKLEQMLDVRIYFMWNRAG